MFALSGCRLTGRGSAKLFVSKTGMNRSLINASVGSSHISGRMASSNELNAEILLRDSIKLRQSLLLVIDLRIVLLIFFVGKK